MSEFTNFCESQRSLTRRDILRSINRARCTKAGRNIAWASSVDATQARTHSTHHSPLRLTQDTTYACTAHRTNSREHFSYRTSHVHRRSHLAYPTDRVDRDTAHTHHDNVASRITKPSSTVTLTVGGERERGLSTPAHTDTRRLFHTRSTERKRRDMAHGDIRKQFRLFAAPDIRLIAIVRARRPKK